MAGVMLVEQKTMEESQGLISWIGHIFSSVTLAGALVGLFPGIAALVALIWYTIQIYESNTFQRWKTSRRLRKMAKLKIEMARLVALELLAYPINRPALLPARKAAEVLLEEARTQAKQIIYEAQHAETLANDNAKFPRIKS